MGKLQHILIVGDPRDVASELPFVNSKDCCFSYCAVGNLDGELRNSRYPYDWVLFSGKSRSLRAVGLSSGDPALSAQSSCQLEWTDQGILRLHCCMHACKQGSIEGQDACIFEYHASMTKTG
ncbi:hypothetical protein MNBD_GAMMA13-1427 [hydrothermal vent metagenome]|uniref:Uncharacterized protein n=1 Tax=hydrothermal vent metagenome TaxID=652676 RepID=A0A3B0YSU5_9ZZZZ